MIPAPFLFLGVSMLHNYKKTYFGHAACHFLFLETFLHFLIFYSHVLQTPSGNGILGNAYQSSLYSLKTTRKAGQTTNFKKKKSVSGIWGLPRHKELRIEIRDKKTQKSKPRFLFFLKAPFDSNRCSWELRN